MLIWSGVDDLFPQGHMSKANLDSLISAQAQAEANMEVCQRLRLKPLDINLSYTEITAPFTGQIGKERPTVLVTW